MPKVKVLTSFVDGRVYRNINDVFFVHNTQSFNHLIKTGQVEEYKEKEVKEQIVTKEFKVEKKTKSIDDLRAEYEVKFGEKPDKRWKEARLLEKLGK